MRPFVTAPAHNSKTTKTTGVPTPMVGRSALLAHRHRGWVLGLPPACEAPSQSHPLVIAVGGGKGGVGKSLLSANLSARLAKAGFKVACLDLDCGGANLHTYFGIMSTPLHLGDWLVKQKVGLADIMLSTGIEGLSIASCPRDDAWAVADCLSGNGLSRFWNGVMGLADLGIQIVLLDLGAGTSRHTIDLFCSAHAGIVTALPEPTSVENAYLFMRTALMRLLQHAATRLGAEEEGLKILEALNLEAPGGAARSYTEKLRAQYQSHPGLVGAMATALTGRLIGILINQTRSQADIDVGKAMEMAAQRYFGFNASYLGYLNYDETAWKSLRNKRLMLLDFPQSVIVRRLNEATALLLRQCGFDGNISSGLGG